MCLQNSREYQVQQVSPICTGRSSPASIFKLQAKSTFSYPVNKLDVKQKGLEHVTTAQDTTIVNTDAGLSTSTGLVPITNPTAISPASSASSKIRQKFLEAQNAYSFVKKEEMEYEKRYALSRVENLPTRYGLKLVGHVELSGRIWKIIKIFRAF
ncbi:uncharacterized protein LOC124153966 [Ischnura elegans]|uniref:uncharacterized protein LOC124153966 n=1 Tax=Ischnura elegans TaxID=197161 RepID=UPI001ED8B1C2|nr:uncharacterized protein LOC124153966 [Ischnura elegans]